MSDIAHSKNGKKQQKFRNIILGIAFLLIAILTVGIFTFRNYPNEKEDVNLSMDNGYVNDAAPSKKPTVKQSQSPETGTVGTEVTVENPDDVYPPEQVIDVEETTPVASEETLESVAKAAIVYIPQTKSLLFHSQNNLDQIQSGKVYYQGENGKLESSINRDKAGIREELTSYDERGNTVDKLEIGYICDSVRHLKCAVIFKNKISIYETKLSGSNKNEELVTEYLISPEMKFSKGKTYTKL